uniref:Rho-GAP domain-containing protein n=1 Tax=Megaselia scalaris TaxID=36166 RepID=T1GLG9_MEGSC
ISITTLEPQSEKINAYRELLSRLYTIEYETLKKLVGHLAFIHSMRSKNKMEIKNLAVIWGPTLLQKIEDVGYSQQDAEVVSDLVLLYKHIFPLSDDEIKKEQEMLMCLQRYYASAETLADSVKQSGDLKIWITVDQNLKKSQKKRIKLM